MTPLSPDAQEARELPDQTIAQRIAWIEQVLKYEPPRLVPYRRELERELLELATDPEERYERA